MIYIIQSYYISFFLFLCTSAFALALHASPLTFPLLLTVYLLHIFSQLVSGTVNLYCSVYLSLISPFSRNVSLFVPLGKALAPFSRFLSWRAVHLFSIFLFVGKCITNQKFPFKYFCLTVFQNFGILPCSSVLSICNFLYGTFTTQGQLTLCYSLPGI